MRPALARAIADEAIVRNLATAPWPYGVADAEAFLAAPRDPVLPTLPDHRAHRRRAAAGRRVRASAAGRRARSSWAIGSRARHWGRGFATEAGAALIEIARTLRLARLEASHFVDNPASGRVLEKLGFVATGLIGAALQLRARRRGAVAAVPAGAGRAERDGGAGGVRAGSRRASGRAAHLACAGSAAANWPLVS